MATDCPRIYYDQDRGIALDLPASRADIDDAGDAIREGAEVTLYMGSQSTGQAILVWDANRQIWTATALGETWVDHVREGSQRLAALLRYLQQLAINPRLKDELTADCLLENELARIVESDGAAEALPPQLVELVAAARDAWLFLEKHATDGASARFRMSVRKLFDEFAGSWREGDAPRYTMAPDWVYDRLALRRVKSATGAMHKYYVANTTKRWGS